MKKFEKVGFLLCLVAMASFVLPVMGCQHSSSSEGISYNPSDSIGLGNNDGELGTSNEDPNTESEGDTTDSDLEGFSYFTIPEAAAYISSLTEAETYYVKVVDYSTTSCDSLKEALTGLSGKEIYISLDLSESVVKIGDAFRECNALIAISLPLSTTSIGERAFYYCSSLESIEIPSSVTSIGSYAFYHCSLLESITIPEGVTSIEGYVFRYCSSLVSIEIPSSVTSIGEGTFYYCSSLESITIPSSVTSIGYNAFYCSKLTSAVFKETKGWTVVHHSGSTTESPNENDLKDETIAAKYLKSTYCSYNWTRE